MLTLRGDGQFQVLKPGGRNTYPPPAVDRRHGRMQQRGNGAGAAQFLQRRLGEPLHAAYCAIIATANQAACCDSHNCYCRNDVAIAKPMDGNQLRDLIRQHGETQTGVGQLVGLSPDKVSKVLAGKRRLTVAEADTLRRYFGLKQESDPASVRQLPIYPMVPASGFREGVEEVIGYMPSPDPGLSREAFAVIVEGDSMNKVADDGEIIIVEPRDRRLVDGGYYVIRKTGGEITFKRYRENPSRLEPCSSNGEHKTIYPGQEQFEIVGRVRKKVTDL